jgi:hypothetical protein
MKSIIYQGAGPMPKKFYLPAVVSFLLIVGALFLPAGDAFDTVRGMTVGFFAVIFVATMVGATAGRRRRSWRQETRTLDDLEPLGTMSFDPIERDRP